MVFSGFDNSGRTARSFLVATDDTKTYPFEGHSVELELATNPTDGQTFTIGDTVYTFVTTSVSSAYEILIHASLAQQTRNNWRHAINDSGVGEGATYGTGTAVHPDALADLSLVTDAIHLVSNTELSLTDGTSGNIAIKQWDETVTTTMVKYGSGDWTHTASMSAAANLVECAVTGLTPYDAQNLSATTLVTYNHSGVAQHKVTLKYASQSPQAITQPLNLQTGAGLAASVTTAADGQSYVHWVGGRDVSDG